MTINPKTLVRTALAMAIVGLSVSANAAWQQRSMISSPHSGFVSQGGGLYHTAWGQGAWRRGLGAGRFAQRANTNSNAHGVAPGAGTNWKGPNGGHANTGTTVTQNGSGSESVSHHDNAVGPNGTTYSGQVNATKSAAGDSATVTRSASNGFSANKSFSNSNGNVNNSVDKTFANGGNVQKSYTDTNGTQAYDVTRKTAAGGTVTKQYSDTDGKFTDTATRTSAAGSTETTTGSGTVGNGSFSDQRSSTYTGANGASETRSVSANDTSTSINRSVNSSGKTADGSAWQRNTSTTGAQGQGATTTGTITGTNSSGQPFTTPIDHQWGSGTSASTGSSTGTSLSQ